MVICRKFLTVVRLLALHDVTLTRDELRALSRCFGQRGKYKGYLKDKKPKNDLERAIWLAIQPNPYKINIGDIMLMPETVKETYRKLHQFNYPDWLDRDKETLQRLGAW